MTIREEVEEMKKEVNEVKDINNIANEVARRANKELSIAKCKITCLTTITALILILGAFIAIYSIHSLKELFYSMEIEETTTETVEQEANSENGDAININGNNNKIGE